MGGFEPFVKREISATFKSRRLRSSIADHRRRISEKITFTARMNRTSRRAKTPQQLYAVSDNRDVSMIFTTMLNKAIIWRRREVCNVGILSSCRSVQAGFDIKQTYKLIPCFLCKAQNLFMRVRERLSLIFLDDLESFIGQLSAVETWLRVHARSMLETEKQEINLYTR